MKLWRRKRTTAPAITVTVPPMTREQFDRLIASLEARHAVAERSAALNAKAIRTFGGHA